MGEKTILWKEKRNRDKLQEQLDLGLSYDQIGSVWQCTRQNIHETIKRYNLKRHPIPLPDKPYICQTCGKERFKTFCPECRQIIEIDEKRIKEEEMKKRNEKAHKDICEEIVPTLCKDCRERFGNGDALLLEDDGGYADRMSGLPPVITQFWNFLKKCKPCFAAFKRSLEEEGEDGLVKR